MHDDGIYKTATDSMNVLVVTVMVQITYCLVALDVRIVDVNQMSGRLTMSYARVSLP